MTADVILGEIIREYFETVAFEMNTTMENTTISQVFSEAHDCSAGVFFLDGKEVSLIARAYAEPVHIFASVHSVQGLVSYYGNDLADGDIVVVSDPYYYGTHIPDYTVMKPVFFSGKPVFFPAVRGHMIEVGGPVAGGYNQDARDTWQEGFRFAPLKLYQRGELRQDIIDMLVANNRQPDVLLGDINAMMGACRLAERRVRALIEKYGVDTVLGATRYMLDYSERRVRDRLAEWPDGTYAGRSVLDGDFAGTRDINVDCTIEIKGDEAVVDFTGSSPQVRGYVNSRPGNTGSWVYSSFSVVFPDIPINSGFFRPISMIMPEGTVVHAVSPAPVGNSTVCIGNDIGQAVMRCLERIVPELVGAAGLDLCPSIFYGRDPRRPDTPFYVSVEYFATPISSGAAYGVDGWGGFSVPHSTVTITTVELQEVVYPILYLQCEYAGDTAAPGRWRGTPAWHCQRQNPDGTVVVHHLSLQGAEHPLQGYAGGSPGAGNYAIVDYGGPNELKVTHSLVDYHSQPGEIIMFQSSGAGGWGPALERDPNLVLEDVRNEFVSVDVARRDYGVVLVGSPPQADPAATDRLRAQLRAERTTESQPAPAEQVG
ncbi:MAG: hydantoinase B/oxoprolinase family protein [Acidimicrobiales bacterium]